MLQPTHTDPGATEAFRISPCLDSSLRHGKVFLFFFPLRNAIDESRKYNLKNDAQPRAIRIRNLVKVSLADLGSTVYIRSACSMNRELLIKIKLRLIDRLRPLGCVYT